MKNILIPTDFSENAFNATRYAMHLYEHEGCAFHFLHTYTPTVYANNFSAMGTFVDVRSLASDQDLVYKESQDGLREILENIVSEHPNERHDYDVLSAYNILTDEINDQIRERHIDLVIMGSKGATNAKEVLFGTNTMHVMRTATCPVLTIPSGFRFRYVDDMLFPSDYKHPYAKNELYPIVEMANLNGARVHTLHISNEPELTTEQLHNRDTINAFFARIAHDFNEVPDAQISRAIEDYIEKHGIGLLTMTRREHSFLERLFFRQKVSKIGMYIYIPFLVLPIK